MEPGVVERHGGAGDHAVAHADDARLSVDLSVVLQHDGVADDDDLVGGLAAYDQVHDGRVQVEAVDDDLDGHAVVGEGDRGEGGRPVVEGWHGVEDVGAAVRARLDRLERLGFGREAVPHGRDHAVFEHELDQLHGVRHFRRERHDLDAAAARLEQLPGESEVDGRDVRRDLVAAFLGVDERPFEVERLRLGVLVAALDRTAHGIDLFNHGIARERDDRGEERGDSVPGEDPAHLVERVLPVEVGYHVRAEAVDMRVDESGQAVGVFELDDLKSRLVLRERRFSADGDDGVLFAQDAAAFDPLVRGQTVVQQEQNATFFLHNNTLHEKK